jgi:hypothetical protein
MNARERLRLALATSTPRKVAAGVRVAQRGDTDHATIPPRIVPAPPVVW